MDMLLPVFFSFLVALAAVILLYIFVLPKKRNGTFSGSFAQWLHDYFRFKKLYIDSVLRFLFTFATIFLICAGIFFLIYFLITVPQKAFEAIVYCLSITVLGPIFLRLFYEVTMMLVMLVQNVMDINRKLDKFSEKEPASAKAPAKPVAERSEDDFSSIFANPAPSYPRPAPVKPAPVQHAAPIRPASAPVRPTPPVPPVAPVRPAPPKPVPTAAKRASTQSLPTILLHEEDNDATVSVDNKFQINTPFMGEEY